MLVRVKQYRMLRGMKQNELARRVGLTQAAVSKIESGINDPAVSTALKMSRALLHPVEKLFILEKGD